MINKLARFRTGGALADLDDIRPAHGGLPVAFLRKPEWRTSVMPVDIDLFRALVGSFPTGVTVVTVLDPGDGKPRGLTSNAFASVSADPPLLLVCVDKRSQTLPSLRDCGAFVVNFLVHGRDAISNVFASKTEDKFLGLHWEASAVANGAPILVNDVLAYAECTVEREIDAGDHVILLGLI
jgi:flavin reductase (DIM6/NTAB) family NADH-FMN oxidoreductase RutF